MASTASIVPRIVCATCGHKTKSPDEVRPAGSSRSASSVSVSVPSMVREDDDRPETIRSLDTFECRLMDAGPVVSIQTLVVPDLADTQAAPKKPGLWCKVKAALLGKTAPERA